MASDRITTSSDKAEIEIRAYFDENKQGLLVLWLVLWSLAGIGILSQFFVPLQEGLFTYLIVWMAFWLYFEYKVVLSFRWRRYGREVITFSPESLTLENRIAGRGIPQRFDRDFIKSPRKVERNERSFWQAMNKGYWNVGNESLVFDYRGREIYFGRELSGEEQGFVLNEIRRWLKD